MIYIGLIAILAALDLFIKEQIENQKPESFPRELKGTKGKITLYQNHNPGFSFGRLKEYPELVRVVPLMIASALGGILAYLLPKKGCILEKLTLAVTLGGAVSNLYDRLVRHYVVDYFSIEWKGLKRVVFNIGDICIFAGAAIMLAVEVIRSFTEKNLE